MKHYKFTHTICYELEAEDEDDAIEQLADLIKHDWLDYIDSGELEEVKAES